MRKVNKGFRVVVTLDGQTITTVNPEGWDLDPRAGQEAAMGRALVSGLTRAVEAYRQATMSWKAPADWDQTVQALDKGERPDKG